MKLATHKEWWEAVRTCHSKSECATHNFLHFFPLNFSHACMMCAEPKNWQFNLLNCFFFLFFFNSIVVVIVRPDTKIPCISTQRQIRAGANSRNTAPTSVRALTLNYADARDWNIGCVVIINNQKHSACIRTMNTVGSGCVFCVCDQPLKSILPQGNRHLPNSYTTTTTAAAAAGDNKIFLIQI